MPNAGSRAGFLPLNLRYLHSDGEVLLLDDSSLSAEQLHDGELLDGTRERLVLIRPTPS